MHDTANGSRASFARHCDRDEFAHLIRACRARERDWPGWRRQVDVISRALGRYAADKGARGELQPVACTDRRHLPRAEAWNALSRGETGCNVGLWAEDPGLSPCSAMCRAPIPDPADPVAMEAAYRRFIDMVDAGDFEMDFKADVCLVTGDELRLRVERWQPRLVRVRREEADGRLTLHQDPVVDEAPPVRVQHVSVPCPSGEVLAGPCIGPEAWIRAVMADCTREERTRGGVMLPEWARTARLARHGVLSLHLVPMSAPHEVLVRQRPGDVQVLLGLSRASAQDFEARQAALEPWARARLAHSFACHRGVMLVDRQVMVDLAARELGAAEARRQVADALEQAPRDLRIVHVPRGSTLHLAHAHGLALGRDFVSDDVDLADLQDLQGVASMRPTRWRARG